MLYSLAGNFFPKYDCVIRLFDSIFNISAVFFVWIAMTLFDCEAAAIKRKTEKSDVSDFFIPQISFRKKIFTKKSFVVLIMHGTLSNHSMILASAFAVDSLCINLEGITNLVSE